MAFRNLIWKVMETNISRMITDYTNLIIKDTRKIRIFPSLNNIRLANISNKESIS